MTTRSGPLTACLLALAGLLACHAEPPEEASSAPRPAELCDEHPGQPGAIRLTADAYARMGLETTTVASSSTALTRTVGGIVIDPLGSVVSMTAPLAGILHAGDVSLEPGTRVKAGAVLLRLTPLAPVDRDLRSQAQRQRESTHARVEMTRARVERIRELLDNKASTARALEEAQAELQVAEAEDRAAQARERALRRAPLDADVKLDLVAPRDGVIRTAAVTPGQVVAGGAALLGLASASAWVRVPVYAGDLEHLAGDAPVRVANLGQPFANIAAQPVLAPPSADPLTNTVDRYYALPPGAEHAPGERVLVELSYASDTARTSAPASAVMIDPDGGSWVYACTGELEFRRQRVVVWRRVGDEVLLASGPPPGSCIVSVGALELYGAEFGVSH